MNKYRVTYTLKKQVVREIEAMNEVHALSLSAQEAMITTNELFRMIEDDPDVDVKLQKIINFTEPQERRIK